MSLSPTEECGFTMALRVVIYMQGWGCRGAGREILARERVITVTFFHVKERVGFSKGFIYSVYQGTCSTVTIISHIPLASVMINLEGQVFF